MARVVVIVEDTDNGIGVTLDIVSDPPFPDDWNGASTAQEICAEFANSIRNLEDHTVHRYYH